MKRFTLVLLVLVMAACSPAPKAPPATATQAPAVAPQATDTLVPTDVPPTETAVPVATDTEAPTAAAASSAAASSAPAQNSFGDITFTNKDLGTTVAGTGSFSVAAFANTCSNVPQDVTLTVSTSNTDIYKINYVYRLTAIDAPTITSMWSGDAKLTSVGNGTFSIDFQSSMVPSDWRSRKAWLDLQFIAFDNKDVRYLSAPILRKITFNQCP